MKAHKLFHGPKSFNLLPNPCLGEKGVKIMNCDGPMCVPEWKSSDGDCQTYQEENYCTEEGRKLC